MARILLTGFMGCGKSTAGKQLARLLQSPFCDLDEQVVALSGQSIADIFRNEGEAAFRQLEAQALRALPDPVVCALGGGAVLQPANLAWIRANALLIYLSVNAQELQTRIERDSTIRPLLFGNGGQMLVGVALRERITSLLSRRVAFYEQAHHIVDASELSPQQTAQKCAELARA